jgi:hypothetical protein
MASRKGIIPAYKFRKDSSGDEFIGDHVNDILGLVEDEVVKAINEERRKCKVEIPTDFEVPYVSRVDAQKRVYFHVIKALKQAEYTAMIQFDGENSNKQKVYIHATWMTKEDSEQDKYMEDFLAAHSVSEKRKKEKRRRK